MSVWLRTFSSTHQTRTHRPPVCFAELLNIKPTVLERSALSCRQQRGDELTARHRDVSPVFFSSSDQNRNTFSSSSCSFVPFHIKKKVIRGTQNDLLFLASPFISVFFFSSCDFLKRVLKHRLCLLPEDSEEVKAGYFRLLWRSFGYLLPSMLTYITSSFFMLRLK